jgi:hypothetical protein
VRVSRYSALCPLVLGTITSLLACNAAKAGLVLTLSADADATGEALSLAIPETQGSLSATSSPSSDAANTQPSNNVGFHHSIIERELPPFAGVIGELVETSERSVTSVEYLHPSIESPWVAAAAGEALTGQAVANLHFSSMILAPIQSFGPAEFTSALTSDHSASHSIAPIDAPQESGDAVVRATYSETSTRVIAIMLLTLGVWWWRLGRQGNG